MRRATLLLAGAALAACAGGPEDVGVAQRGEAAFQASFAGGDAPVLARVERQDEAQRLCSRHRNAPPESVARQILRSQRAAIVYPAGALMGDWREGKKIAEGVLGLRYAEPAGNPNGGNCYACHQLAPGELAFGTLGPSLLGYGRTHGASREAQRRTYEKIYNAQAFVACSAMPRFGHNRVLSPEQIAHVVALLLDARSEVNAGTPAAASLAR